MTVVRPSDPRLVHQVLVRLAGARQTAVVIAVPEQGVDVLAVERALIAFALERVSGNRTRAAKFLSLSRSALIYRMHKYGLATIELPSSPQAQS